MGRHRLCQEAKKVTDRVTTRQESTLKEQHNILRKQLHAWEEILPIYMPGLLQYRNTLESERAAHRQSNSTPTTDHPEDTVIWLPSQIPNNIRTHICTVGLAEIEEKIHTAHCYDNLNAVRRVLNIKSRMVAFKNKNVRGQHDGLQSRTVIDHMHERARVAAEKYRSARRALLALAGPGDWEKMFCILNDGDVCGYQDPEQLRVCSGRKGTLEDGQATAAQVAEEVTEDDVEMEDDVAEIDLYLEARDKRDGTGETCRMLSWIWTTDSQTPNSNDDSDEILRVEWVKSQAQAARCKEEVLLLKEEMHRVIAFLDWKTKWWMDRREARAGVKKDLLEGLRAYAEVQADLQVMLKENFCTIWRLPLDSNAEGLQDEVDDDGDDGDEDDTKEDNDKEHSKAPSDEDEDFES